VDALLARQTDKPIRWPSLLRIAFLARLVPPIPGALRLHRQHALHLGTDGFALYRRLDAQRPDAKEAIQATGDPATYIQALVKADRLMQEIPRRLRMSTWWLLPVSLEARIAPSPLATRPPPIRLEWSNGGRASIRRRAGDLRVRHRRARQGGKELERGDLPLERSLELFERGG